MYHVIYNGVGKGCMEGKCYVCMYNPHEENGIKSECIPVLFLQLKVDFIGFFNVRRRRKFFDIFYTFKKVILGKYS